MEAEKVTLVIFVQLAYLLFGISVIVELLGRTRGESVAGHGGSCAFTASAIAAVASSADHSRRCVPSILWTATRNSQQLLKYWY